MWRRVLSFWDFFRVTLDFPGCYAVFVDFELLSPKTFGRSSFDEASS